MSVKLEPRYGYEYPKLNPNWDLLILTVKLYGMFELRPDSNTLFVGLSGGDENIIIHTARKLTVSEKTKLDVLMNDVNIGLYPTSKEGFTVFEIRDVFDSWRDLEQTSGIKIKWMFCNVPRHDYLEIWVEGKLSIAKKKKLIEAYSCLITEKMV